MYTKDLAKVMIWSVALDFLGNNIQKPLIVCGEEVAISSVAESVVKAVKGSKELGKRLAKFSQTPEDDPLNIGIEFQGGHDGPLRRTAEVSHFTDLWKKTTDGGEFNFTPFDVGCLNSLEWYMREGSGQRSVQQC